MTNHKISNILFYIFILLLPWQTRLILFPDKSEYLGFSVYLSEIFLWMAIVFWLTNTDFKKIKIPFVFSFFCFFVFLSILWSPDKIAAFRLWLYVFDGLMIYLYAQEQKGILKNASIYFFVSLFFSACLGIWQFFTLGSLAWKWLGLAERGAWNLGDIVIESGGRFLRAYGSMPHPNILGGYLAAGILLLFFWQRSRRNYFVYCLAGIFFLALFLTFSRSAWIAFAIALTYLAIKNRGTKKIFTYFLLLAIALSVIFWPFVKTRGAGEGRLENKSNIERLASWKSGAWIVKENFLFGTGAGNYVAELGGQLKKIEYANPNQISLVQPAHNIFLLVLSELGVFGFLIYLFVWKRFWQNHAARPFLILFFIIGLFDHYLWTLYSGQMLFWVSLAMLSDE